MGETADQTRRELIQLRTQMSASVASLRRSTQATARRAAPLVGMVAAIGAAVGTAVVLARRRRRAEERSLRAKLHRLAGAVENPGASLGSLAEASRDKVRKELNRELAVQPSPPPLSHKLAEAAVRSAVSAAVPFLLKAVMRKLAVSPNEASRP